MTVIMIMMIKSVGTGAYPGRIISISMMKMKLMNIIMMIVIMMITVIMIGQEHTKVEGIQRPKNKKG